MTNENETGIAPANVHGLAIVQAPRQALEHARQAAEALMEVVEQQGLAIEIGNGKHLQFEAWQTLAHFYGVTVGTESVEANEMGGFTAKAIALRDGIKVGSAISECNPDEDNWRNKPRFQLMSMAQTRAQAKALRSVLSFVAVLAGFDGTPAEEAGRANSRGKGRGRSNGRMENVGDLLTWAHQEHGRTRNDVFTELEIESPDQITDVAAAKATLERLWS